jgi:CO dehydrogenase maturation factor
MRKGNRMKIAVCGKGGSGKSTVVALMANVLPKRGYEVWVVDSDESNPGLYRLLGLDRRPRPLLELVGGKKQVFQAYSGGSALSPSVLTQDQIRTEDLPSQYVVARDHVQLVCVGKILQSLEGCACPMGALSREFLKRLSLKENEVVLVDTEAGIEHFGRGVEASVDSVLAVTEPSLDSLELAAKIGALAAQVGIESTWAVLNKVGSEEMAARLREDLQRRGIPVIGSIGHDPQVSLAGLEGRPTRSSRAEEEIKGVLAQLL